jgi:hypothetical protein
LCLTDFPLKVAALAGRENTPSAARWIGNAGSAPNAEKLLAIQNDADTATI